MIAFLIMTGVVPGWNLSECSREWKSIGGPGFRERERQFARMEFASKGRISGWGPSKPSWEDRYRYVAILEARTRNPSSDRILCFRREDVCLADGETRRKESILCSFIFWFPAVQTRSPFVYGGGEYGVQYGGAGDR